MNHFPNNNSRKFIFPPQTASHYCDIQRNFEVGKKQKEESQTKKKFEKNKPTGALKIFLESENLNRDEPRFEWNLKKKNLSNCLERNSSDNNSKGKKEKKRNRKKTNSPESLVKGPEWHVILQNSFTNDYGKNEGKAKPKSEPHNLLSRSDFFKTNETADKLGKETGLEKAPINSLFTIRKESSETEKKAQKLEVIPGNSPSIASRELPYKLSLQKAAKKTSSKNETPEVKITNSDYRKIHINEILKGHAQKVQTNPIKSNQQLKDYSFQGVNELLQKVKNIGNPNAIITDVNKKEKKVEKEEAKINKEKSEEPKEKEIKVTENAEFECEDKKKTASTWMNLPQSNELERRLKNSWQEPTTLYLHVKPNETGIEEEEKAKKPEGKCNKSENSKEEIKKDEKKVTYINRVLFARTSNKETNEIKEGKEEAASNVKKSSEDKKEDGENAGIIIKKNEAFLNIKPSDNKALTGGPIREITFSSYKEVQTIKDVKQSDGEQIFKTKATRSTELRDLVTQAIKEHKIFCIFDNHWYIVRPVREELLSRGWLEVIPDRRLIPRRRPPPMGPTYDRDKTTFDHTIEAILTAKETFADEIQEKVSKSTSFRSTIEKAKPLPITAPILPKKSSDESLNEVLSQFRIIPPTSEKKKNNFEIREFVSKYQAMQEKDKKFKEKEKNVKSSKKDKGKNVENLDKGQKKELEKMSSAVDARAIPSSLSKSLQAILDSINDNKKTILQAAEEMKNMNIKTSDKTALGLLFNSSDNSSNPPAPLPLQRKESLEKAVKRTADTSSKFGFTESESKTISKIIQSTNARIHFMWLSIKPSIHLKCFNYSPEIVNKFQKTTFCTKIGLWNHLNNIQWYAHEVHFPAKSPRMYNTGEADDLQAFFQDFQLTACLGILKWLADTFFDRGMKAVQTKKGKVPLKAFEFAIKQCERYMRFKENEDLSLIEEPKVLQEEWNTFLQWFYIITNDHGKVQESSSAQLMVVYTKAVETLRTMKRHWPEIDIDGRLNIWIMKPYCASCGRGIFMTNNVYYIGQHSKYIVQKYIEKPLLIYNTKFDIRQWFMITKLTPLEIWMYKECYLRFCTQPFALRNLHESVHLSNNSVQRKYISFRDPSLPDQNMWDSNTFQLYLKTIGHPNAWEDIIYPGMRDAIVSTMLAAQDTFDGPRRNWFEVYGADFMLSANLKDGPWLIEINENPAMDPSTKVTAKLCPQMLRDVIKVVVDKRANKNASTGEWELIYRQNYSPSFGTVDLDVRGKKIARVPPTMKMTLNIPHHPSTSPSNSKRQDTEDNDLKLYDVVKSFNGNQNNKGDINDFLNKSKKSKEKLSKVIQTVEKEIHLKTIDLREPLTSKMNTEKNLKNHQNLHGEDKTNMKQVNDKKQNSNDSKIFGKVPDATKILAQVEGLKKEKNSKGKITKENKNTISVSSSSGRLRLKRVRVNSLPGEPSKRTNLGSGLTEKKGNDSNAELRFSGMGNKKVASRQEESNYTPDKFKFTKFYKV